MPDNNDLASMTISEILDQWPRTARVFYQHKMACVGCALAPFYSLEEAVGIYHLSLDELRYDLLAVIAEESQNYVTLELTPPPFPDHS
ncbi:MAG: DUF1858 domain-containing protein [Chloroflexi bacterium]|nr:DUF1858 domain-containing protein [Chloroflexota bacterium]